MRDFLTQYSAHRFALDRHRRRQRGQHGFLASVVLGMGWVLVMAAMLPIVVARLLLKVAGEVRQASNDPTFRGTLVDGRTR